MSASLSPGMQERDWRLRWAQAQRDLTEVTSTRHEPLSGDTINTAAARLHAFYIQTYHIKDVLKADSSTGVAPKDIENAISADSDLALLADLANLDKHGRLSAPPRSGSVPKIESVQGGTFKDGWRLTMVIEHGGKRLDGLDVANDAVAAWRRALMGWGLI
ncbi:MAG: hypothetical protein ACYDD4_05095 [Acidimicrobiales bacterium]